MEFYDYENALLFIQKEIFEAACREHHCWANNKKSLFGGTLLYPNKQAKSINISKLDCDLEQIKDDCEGRLHFFSFSEKYIVIKDYTLWIYMLTRPGKKYEYYKHSLFSTDIRTYYSGIGGDIHDKFSVGYILIPWKHTIYTSKENFDKSGGFTLGWQKL